MRPLLRPPAPFKVFALALIAYGVSAKVGLHPTSLAPHYVYLADALLHGQVHLIHLPPTTYDLLQHNGQWYVAGSPMPSIMMLPFVALFGLGFSDVLFSVVLGAINVALVYSLLGRLTSRSDTQTPREDKEISARLSGSAVISFSISESSRRWITLLFALGTPHWYLAALGSYWFAAHVVAVFFALWAVREALTTRRWFLSGLWLACAGFARPTALFLTPFFVILMIEGLEHSTPAWLRGWTVTTLAPFALAVLLGVGAQAAYNYVRFRSIGDFCYSYVAAAGNIPAVHARHVGFKRRFAPGNLS